MNNKELALRIAGGTGAALGIVLIVLIVLTIVSLPFAFLGWVVTTMVSLFAGPIAVSYFKYIAVGVGTAIILGLVQLWLKER